jgi:hypothetical protein
MNSIEEVVEMTYIYTFYRHMLDFELWGTIVIIESMNKNYTMFSAYLLLNAETISPLRLLEKQRELKILK